MTEEAPVSEIETFDEEVVENNLKKMEDDMMKLLFTESIGGNAGHVEIRGKEYPCSGARGYANNQTGEIVTFGNIQDVSSEILDNNSSFIMKVAVDFKHPRMFFNIVDTGDLEVFSSKARKNIREAASRYNEKYAHQKTPTKSG